MKPTLAELAGKLLVSHPALRHDAFRRTVIFLSAQSQGGPTGIVLNRPTGKTLGSYAPAFSDGPLNTIPLYTGGPVSPGTLLFCAWGRLPNGGFQIKIGLSKEQSLHLLSENNTTMQLRCFRGHASWSPGQLENELQNNAWVVTRMDSNLLLTTEGDNLWNELLAQHHPFLRLLASAPSEIWKN
ncbi:MAG: YqgE/AlgH family protein [Puniceicoccales bacterium]|jgi:putative transcriptional regulator|nr:YqgE/AlgH family protein [Puniceicoccales bacterium]